MKTLKSKIVRDRIDNFKDIEKRTALGTLIGELDRISKDPEDTQVIATIKKMIEGCKEVGSQEKLDEIEIIKVYLPEELTEEELTSIIKSEIEKNNYVIRDMGKVMKYLTENYSGQYDGKKASIIVKGLL
jgi:uncharacterized protein YqeY